MQSKGTCWESRRGCIWPNGAACPIVTRLQVTNQNGLQWVGEALAGIPDEAVTSADKQRFMNACQQVGAGAGWGSVGRWLGGTVCSAVQAWPACAGLLCLVFGLADSKPRPFVSCTTSQLSLASPQCASCACLHCPHWWLAQPFCSAPQVVAGGLSQRDERVLQQAVDELSELCRRNRRSAQLAQRALLPPELHYTIR